MVPRSNVRRVSLGGAEGALREPMSHPAAPTTSARTTTAAVRSMREVHDRVAVEGCSPAIVESLLVVEIASVIDVAAAHLRHRRATGSYSTASHLLGDSRAIEREVCMSETAKFVVEDDGRIRHMAGKWAATVDDLRHVEGKAELVNGELVLLPMTSGLHGFAAGAVFGSLLAYQRQTKRGYALPDGVGFVVSLEHRRSFSPDAAFATQALTNDFVGGAPVFAVEVRSKEDYGPAAERAMAEKRADYFAVGTRVVWDVDTLKDQVVRVHRASDPTAPTTYRRGERAEAEPAVPEWSMPVDDLFPD